ncbi:PQQ-binding-like beta-propeller repeat protein [Streptomyces sp. NPDC059897]|uniref:protein kinase domain-containing protein n=1 Tax=Streptomyces sp. NPDC059897 TaxID=3346994 RepID=UPI003663C7E7
MADRILADRYRLVRPLGQGGMGEVWEARDEVLGRPVAVKVISMLAGGGSGADDARARFLREARITAALQHPHIVTVHDVGTAVTPEGSTPFLVMELLRGEGLEAAVRRGPVGGAQAARWGGQICEALAEAHAAGVLHRDIKPANLFVTPSDRIKVLDFGIARAADASATDGRLTRTGLVIGTAAYMAPEQARGYPEQSSDLYAMGCVLFELRTGRLPFTAPDTLGFLTAHLNDVPPAPSSIAPDLSPAWDALILRLLAKDPQERYGSATELGDALRELEGGAAPATPVPVPRSGHPPTVVDPQPAPAVPVPLDAAATITAAQHGTPETGGRRELSRRGLLLGGAGFAAVATAGISAGVYLTADPGHDAFAWSHNLGERREGWDQPLLSGTRCFVPAHDGAAIQAFELTGGKHLWKRDLGLEWPLSGASQAAAVDDGDTVLALVQLPQDRIAMLYVLDGATGRTRWKRELYDEDDYDLHVLDRSGLVLFGDGDPYRQTVTAFDARTGKERWTQQLDDSGPVEGIGDMALVGSTALDGATGKQLWDRPGMNLYTELGQRISGPQRTDDALLFHDKVTKKRIDLVLLGARTGTEKWRVPLSEVTPVAPNSLREEDPPAAPLSGTTLLLPRLKGERTRPTAIDVRTGKEKWTFKGEAPTGDRAPDPVSTPGGFVLPTADGVVCLNAADGKERWRAEGGTDLDIASAGAYTMVRHTRTARLLQSRRTVRVLRSADGRTLWKGEFTASLGNSDPLATGRTLAFLDPQDNLRGIRLTVPRKD